MHCLIEIHSHFKHFPEISPLRPISIPRFVVDIQDRSPYHLSVSTHVPISEDCPGFFREGVATGK